MPPTTAAARTPTVPPFAHWISPSLLSLIESSPANPDLRGLIRRELNVALPREGEMTTERIKETLTEKFQASKPFVTRLKVHFDAGRSMPNLYADGGRAMREDPTPVAQPAPRRETPPAVRVDADGSFVLTGISLSGTERGRATFENTITYTGQLTVPGEVARQGEAAVRDWIRTHREGLEENTENYLYDEFETAEVRIDQATVNEAVLTEAMRQVAGQQMLGQVAAGLATGGATARNAGPAGEE